MPMKKGLFLLVLCIMVHGLFSCSNEGEISSQSNSIVKSRSVRDSLDFPPVEAMVNHPIVIHAMEMAWRQMKAQVASGNGRSEFGFYIYYLPEQNTFSVGDIVEGGVVTECAGTRATINLGVVHNNLTVCGFFHCHTSIERCPIGDNRPTGPSPSDIAIAVERKLPGILYDYSESRITAGNHRANDPYRYYLFGPTFRPTIPYNN
jgi:hypothetical protein